MYTGDDFNYAELIAGDAQGYSTRCSASLMRSRRRHPMRCRGWLLATRPVSTTCSGPTVPLSRHIFKAPTRFYKTGIVFMAYLNGHQDHFTMAAARRARARRCISPNCFGLADKAGLLANPEMATRRMQDVAFHARYRA
jgi:hypothetical protein